MPDPPVPRQVTVIYDQEGKFTVVPYVVRIYQDVQKIVWRLVSQVEGVDWDYEVGGIQIDIDPPPPPPYSPWPGQQAAPCETHPTRYCADAGDPLPGPPAKLYRYWINLVDVNTRQKFHFGVGLQELKSEMMLRYDPDISNDPQPKP